MKRNNLMYSFTSLFLLVCVGEVIGQCLLNPTLKKDDDKKATKPRQTLLDRINKIDPSIRNTEITAVYGDKTYFFKICPDRANVNDNSSFYEKEKADTRTLGRMNETDAILASTGDILLLTYTNGDDYNNACNKTERRAVTLIRSTSVEKPVLVLTEESVGQGEDFCYYVFELFVPSTYFGDILKPYAGDLFASTPPVTVPTTVHVEPTVVSTQKSVVTSSSTATGTTGAARGIPAAQTGSATASTAALSTGSIILILVLVPLFLFFAVGSAYKRFVVGAQGWEQVPFIDFWRGCWSMQADGWRYVFGRRVRGNSYNDYTAVSTDEERQPALDRGSSSNNNDDHLLPM
ncbi:cation-dependent mannose-6-phosphate receptor-like isoform X1 [Paramacrobiotus metropolitanus]|uniref:cation-dependent mannose-6-phosphate receptor-like isoform X1 n=1 Tax=Paramacrobiotus metropolitanus TaxID=2943436 RepID=UPI00244608C7|nr:cation-dependent mannose-6-phosphate receptor-like isoform X1 [Paramacrobiotus metropolitanus]XP_055339919.1 cation-dependent mannose-6-phosphate receptor-like isoform X1 [Paramacrobiotus metropolitanus]XP_055339920.1 cation-dependent mannose-6-phosphate receptor-like isoform X1 [Paramacrobiotus metropolitanus]XP_055339921.1 cation-dependent mannose-6-phosphate receptor-like isoform X1 [Paramacrobiotus metropolitanus]